MGRYIRWFFIGGLILVCYIWEQMHAVRMGYVVENAQHECDRWSQANRVLRLEVSQLISLDRLDKAAKDRKLSAPDSAHIVNLE